MSDPMFLTAAELRAAYDALGLDPDRFDDTRSIRIDTDGVQILRYQQRPPHFSGSGDALATELLTLQLGPPPPVDLLALALSGPTDPDD